MKFYVKVDFMKCHSCQNEVDWARCRCGEGRGGHPLEQGHVFTPMGCQCLRTFQYPKATVAPDGRGKDRQYVGIYRNGPKWIAMINVNNTTLHLGTYETPREAALARDQYIRTHKLHHKLNFPPHERRPHELLS